MLELKNAHYRLLIDEQAGCIAALYKGENNLLSTAQPPIFRVQFRDEAGQALLYTAADTHTLHTAQTADTVTLSYTGVGGKDITVTLRITCDDTALSRWSVTVSGSEQLEWIEYGGLRVKDNFRDSENGGNSKLLFPYNEGVLISDIHFHNAKDTFKEPTYPSCGDYAMYPGMMFAPFLAVTSDEGGLYFAAHDAARNTRNIDFCRTGGGVELRMRVYPGVYGGSYTADRDVVIGVFDGDWYAAADIYRTWFENHLPEGLYRITENPNLPAWYGDSPVVLSYCVRGHFDTDVMDPNKLFPYMNGLPLIEEYAKRLGSRIMVILMHWEGTAPWAPPYMWPPYGGEAALKDYIDALHAQGHLLGLYCSGFGWTQTSRIADYDMQAAYERENLREVMCASPAGDVPLGNICPAQRTGYDLCPSTAFCRDTMVNEVRGMAGLGVDYAQLLDQNHGGTPYMCYSKKHGHPPVPGKWESEAALRIMQDVQAVAGDRKMLFGCESAAAEVLMPALLFSDNRFELNFNRGVPVPLYSYIYHEYINNFMGNQVCLEYTINCRTSPENLLYRIAYAFAAGDFLTLLINDEGRDQWAWGQSDFSEAYMPDGDAAIGLTAALNRWRQGAAKKYIHTGRMLHPVEAQTAQHCVFETESGMLTVSPIVCSRWQAADGTVGQFLVNILSEPITCRVAGAAGQKLWTDDETYTVLTGDTVTVPPLGAVLLTDK